MNIEILANWATVIGAPVGILALIYAAVQLKHSASTSQGQFLLELERMSFRHDEVHLKLRGLAGEWCQEGSGPRNAKEWALVDDYMGFFEHCEILIRKGSLNFHDFNDIFGYRVRNIINNSEIVEKKLKGDTRKYWLRFIDLLGRMGIKIPA